MYSERGTAFYSLGSIETETKIHRLWLCKSPIHNLLSLFFALTRSFPLVFNFLHETQHHKVHRETFTKRIIYPRSVSFTRANNIRFKSLSKMHTHAHSYIWRIERVHICCIQSLIKQCISISITCGVFHAIVVWPIAGSLLSHSWYTNFLGTLTPPLRRDSIV